jgi:hypothetical protein
MHKALLVSLAIILLLWPGGPQAQIPGQVMGEFANSPTDSRGNQPDTFGRMALGGLALGGVGFCGGFFLSAEMKDLNVFNDDVTDPFYIGSAFGAAGLATGVHLGNERRGSWPLTTLVSLLVGAGGSYWIVESPDDSGGLLFLVPFLQLSATMAVQRWTTPNTSLVGATTPRVDDKRETSLARIGLLPVRGGAGFVISGAF